MSTLGLRVVTALILMPAAAAMVLLLPTQAFLWVLLIFPLLGTWEWARLCGITRGPKLALAYGISLAILLILGVIEAKGGVLWVIFPTTVFWLGMTIALGIRRSRPINPGDTRGLSALAGPFLLGVTWISLVAVHRSEPEGHILALFLLVLIWVADSGAYFAGRSFGSRKLAPAISPGKTLEGVAGAVLGALLAGIIFMAVWPDAPLPTIGFLLLCVVTTLTSVTGDLFESLVKRRHGVKDSGALLPGHGGVLDRIDSIMAAAPVFYSGLVLLELA